MRLLPLLLDLTQRNKTQRGTVERWRGARGWTAAVFVARYAAEGELKGIRRGAEQWRDREERGDGQRLCLWCGTQQKERQSGEIVLLRCAGRCNLCCGGRHIGRDYERERTRAGHTERERGQEGELWTSEGGRGVIVAK